MKAIHLLAAVIALILSASEEAHSFGTKRTHQELADQSVTRADAEQNISAYLREQLGLRRGIGEPLAIQFRFDPTVDDDLIVGDDPETRETIETRLNRSLSRYDEDENGNPARFPLAPEKVRVFFHENCRAALDFETCFADLPRADVSALIRIGTYAEDNPNPRSQHHFHDPERSHGLVGHGLDNASQLSDSLSGTLVLEGVTSLLRGGSWLRAIAGVLLHPLRPLLEDLGNFDLRGRSAADRAVNATLLGPASAAHPDNRFALPDAERYLFRALTAPQADEREHYLALHFLAVGHVLHLLHDMGSVAHVRNDFIRDHVVVDLVLNQTSLEAAGDNPRVFPSVLAEVVEAGLASRPYLHLLESGSGTAPLSFFEAAQPPLDPAGFDVVDFWDRGAFDDPDDLDPSRAGLAERVHNRFFSAGSVSNFALTNGYDRPLVTGCAEIGSSVGSGRDAVLVTELRARSLPTGEPIRPDPEDTYRFASSPLVPHLARCRYHAAFESAIGEPRGWELTVIDDSVQRDYLELLFPLVIDYGARFLEHYLAPRLEVVPVGRGEFRLRNLSELPLRADARAVEIAYTAVDPQRPEGIRVRVPADCGSGEFELLPAPAAGAAGPPSDFLCRLPESLPVPALDRSDFFVLVRGALGARGVAAGPEAFDAVLDREDFVLAFDHVQPRILVHRATVEIADAPDKDRRFPIDVVSLPFEPERPLEEGEFQGAGTNLTGALRAAIGGDALDFLAPVGEPGGPRILLRSDRDATRLSSLFGDVAAPLGLFLFDPTKSPVDPAALLPIPMSEIDHLDSRLRLIGVWSLDGAAIFFYEGRNSNTLWRFDPVSEQMQRFGPEAFASSRDPDEGPEELPLGAERETCSGIAHLSARSADQIAVTADCRRQVVAVGSSGSGHVWSTVSGRNEVRIAVVEPSATVPGFLEARFTARFDVGGGRVVACGGFGPASCATVSNEPSADGASDQMNPSWSPDGTKLVFLRDPESPEYVLYEDRGREIWIADLSTGDLRLAMTGDHGRILDPRWSPDGRWLVFSTAQNPFDLFTIPADSLVPAEPRRLTLNFQPFSFDLHGPLLLPDDS